MKIFINIFAYFIVICIAFLSCNNNSSEEQNDNSSSNSNANLVSSSSSSDYQPPTEKPIMDSRVVSYQRTDRGYEYMNSLRSDYFTSDENVLKAWFPHIFNEGQTESECNYFAKYAIVSSYPPTYYYTLAKDMVFYVTRCTYKTPYPSVDEMAFETMLICDDKAGTIRNAMELGSIPWEENIELDWICGKTNPNIEDIYF